jgi:NAD(P)H-dependent FMN reductase
LSRPLLQVIAASTREGRKGIAVAHWLRRVAEAHDGFDVELVDLADVGLPLLDEPNQPWLAQYRREHTRGWSAIVSRAEAFVFVTPEYNHSFPASLKNALDFLHREWAYKPAGVVSYGGRAGGVRAAEALKLVLIALSMIPASGDVSIRVATSPACRSICRCAEQLVKPRRPAWASASTLRSL